MSRFLKQHWLSLCTKWTLAFPAQLGQPALRELTGTDHGHLS